jgi:AcrR family transcriptional regulator
MTALLVRLNAVCGTARERSLAARQRRGAVRSQILEAARQLLAERPWSEVTIDDIMSRAGHSRTIFYRYFDDRPHLLLSLMAEFGDQMAQLGEDWLAAEANPMQRLCDDLDRLVDLYVAHGPILRAIAAAASDDPDINEAYSRMADRFCTITSKRIEIDVALGSSSVEDPQETARALVWLAERYLVQSFGYPQRVHDPAAVKRTLHMIWLRSIYGGLQRRAARAVGRR